VWWLLANSWNLLKACNAFAERMADKSVDMLREVVCAAHRPFKDYLVGVHEDSVRFSQDVALAEFTEKTCYPIMRNRRVLGRSGGHRDQTD
jgi:hypothetical protein